MQITDYILPYPYEAYTSFNRRFRYFDSYKNRIYDWVKNNTSRLDVSEAIEKVFSCVEKSERNEAIKIWMKNHIDKLKYMNDFSGLSFGIRFDEHDERIEIAHPMYIDEEDRPLYPNYNEKEFHDMNVFDKLEWMNANCEFIPFRLISEDINVDWTSYRFSHIKRDPYIMRLLQEYLCTSKYLPSDSVYYYIRRNAKSSSYYLSRDNVKSPKKYKQEGK